MMGYGPEDKNAVMELTYNYGVTDYEKGNAYAQVLYFFFPIFIKSFFLTNLPNIQLGLAK